MGLGDGEEGFSIEMICMKVAGGDEGEAREMGWGEAAFRHAHMRFIRVRIFFRQGIGEVRIEEEGVVGPFDEKAALAEPPEVQAVWLRRDAGNVLKEGSILQEGEKHGDRKEGSTNSGCTELGMRVERFFGRGNGARRLAGKVVGQFMGNEMKRTFAKGPKPASLRPPSPIRPSNDPSFKDPKHRHHRTC
jgi:hypothetical protein